MSVTVEDYERALDAYLDEASRLGDDLVAVLLYGSMAQGKLRPGHSDIDAYVVLRNEVFDERERYLRALEILVEAADSVAQSGIPFHPFHYFSLDELRRVRADFVPLWHHEGSNRVVFGQDVRSHIATTAVSRFRARSMFFEARQVVLPLTSYLYKPELSIQDCQKIIRHLGSIRRFIPKLACITLDIRPDFSVGEEEFKKLFPEVETSVLRRIDALRELTDEELKPAAVRETLSDSLNFLEHANDALLSRLRAKSEAARTPDYVSLLVE
ncbi:MAG: nucleotidyltransferase domain-containing protein [Acidobacteria bacterium]|nr:nucleotidyltransferase domain-containing protein [Acidobacteriota bacterium]